MLLHIYTANNLTRQYSILFSHSLHDTLHIFTYSHFPCLSPIENSLLKLTHRTDFLDIPVSLIKPSIVQTSLLSGRGVYRSVSQQRARWGVCVTSLAETRRSHDIPLLLVPCDIITACPVSQVTQVTSSHLCGSLVYRLVLRRTSVA
jgi:hypothetical protein